MYCNKCGFLNEKGNHFCKKCGSSLGNDQLQQPVNNVDNMINKMPFDANICAILSVIIPVIGIIWYCFIGLSFFFVIFIATFGFFFAINGKVANKRLSTIGMVLNGIFIGLGIVTIIIRLISVFIKVL